MGFFSNIREWIMGLFSKTDVKKVTGLNPQISDGMMTEIENWRAIYSGEAPWRKRPEFDKSTGFAKTVCRDIAQKCTSEGNISTGIDDVDRELADITSALPEKVEKVLALGSGVARPYLDEFSGMVKVDWYTADKIVPLAWHGEELRSVCLLDFVRISQPSPVTYVKVETHRWGNRSTTITSKAYIWNDGRLGASVPLSTVPEWAEISEEPVEILNIDHPIFAYLKTPIANNIDGSKVGVSIYANAIDQLEEIDNTFSLMAWEGKATKAKVFVAESMIPQKMVNGKPVDDLTAVDREMYKKLDGNVESNLFEVSTPMPRYDAYKAHMDELIVLACKNMGLDAKSFTADHQGNPVTAQQILSEKNETYTTVLNLQEKMLKPALRKLLQSMRVLQILYSTASVIPENEDEISITFGDSILVDEESERTMAMSEVQRGLRSKMSYLMEYRGLSEEDAIRELEQIKSDTPVVDYFGTGEGM